MNSQGRISVMSVTGQTFVLPPISYSINNAQAAGRAKAVRCKFPFWY